MAAVAAEDGVAGSLFFVAVMGLALVLIALVPELSTVLVR